jgi:hypothetical protein
VAPLRDIGDNSWAGIPAHPAQDRRRLVAEGLEKGARDVFLFEKPLREARGGFFDFNGVHGWICGQPVAENPLFRTSSISSRQSPTSEKLHFPEGFPAPRPPHFPPLEGDYSA